MTRRIIDWLEHRTGIETAVRNFLYEDIPYSSGWRQVFGSVALFLFFVQVFTGILLAFNYAATPGEAYNSVKYIMTELTGGKMIRGLHHWGATMMIAVVVIHMLQVFIWGAYKKPREATWMVGVVLLLMTLGYGLTGYLLPWDQLAYWAITIGSNIANSPRELTDALGITSWFDPGGFQTRLLLGANYVGQDALIRFYVLHVFLLPLALVTLLSVHFWRIRKDGGMTRPADVDRRLGRPPADTYPVFTEQPTKTYHLAAIVRGRTAAVGRGPENTVPSMPHLLYGELGVVMVTVLVCVGLALLSNAPLKELANANIPENPAKAPWYFLGLQELVSFSAFMGGTGIPAIVLIGLGLIPFLDRDERGTGVWFGGPGGWSLVIRATLVGFVVPIVVEAWAIRFGWLREWFPHVPQLVITCVNPGTVIVVLYSIYSIWLVGRHNSARAGALGLFTCAVCGFVVLTVIGTHFRGPNWGFYWSPSQWPLH